mgnify:CR=1 FL=1
MNWDTGLKSEELTMVREYFGLNEIEGLVYSYLSVEDEVSIHNNFFERIGLPKYTINSYIRELITLTIKGLVYFVEPFNHYSDEEKTSLVVKDNVGNMIFRTNKNVLLQLDRDKYETDEFINYILLVHKYLSIDDFIGLGKMITVRLVKFEIINQINFENMSTGDKWLLMNGITSILNGNTEFEINQYENHRIDGSTGVDGLITKETQESKRGIMYKVEDELIKICNVNYPNLFLHQTVPF